MKKYNEKTHAKRLIKMLENDHCCGGCPASKGFRLSASFIKNKGDAEVCTVCLNFVGLEAGNIGSVCPCDALEDSVVKVSWLALEEKGYI